MNQTNLVPDKLSPVARFGIEIEMKLAGDDQFRDEKSPIKKSLEKYKDFIELGKDCFGSIAELRTLEYGFPLDHEHQKLLFNVINEFHKSTDLSLFLSNHIHVDSDYKACATGNLIDFSMDNNSGRTHEMKSLDTCTRYLDAQNPDLYNSFDMSTLIDQMVVLEELKHEIMTPFAIKQAKEIRAASGLDLNTSVLIAQAAESAKGHIIPNILRLAESNRAYIETVAEAHLGEEKLDLDFMKYSLYKVSLTQNLINALKEASETEQLGFRIQAESMDHYLTNKFLFSPEISIPCKDAFLKENIKLPFKADDRARDLFDQLKRARDGDQFILKRDANGNLGITEPEVSKAKSGEAHEDKVAVLIADRLDPAEISKRKNWLLEYTSEYFPEANQKIVDNVCENYRLKESFLHGYRLTEDLIGFMEHVKSDDDAAVFL